MQHCPSVADSLAPSSDLAASLAEVAAHEQVVVAEEDVAPTFEALVVPVLPQQVPFATSQSLNIMCKKRKTTETKKPCIAIATTNALCHISRCSYISQMECSH